jgi:hypothetical protein
VFEVCQTPPLLRPHDTAIVESGCTGHFLLVNAPCLSKVKSQTPLTVRLPNGAIMESSHTAELNIPELNAVASKAHFSPGMASHYLLSVGQLYSEGYIVTFKNASVTVCNSHKFQILSGPRDLDTGLWCINLIRDSQKVQQSVEKTCMNYVTQAPLSTTFTKPCSAQRNMHCSRRSKTDI